MDFVKFVLSNGHYSIRENNDKLNILQLAFFLTSDVGLDWTTWKEFLDNPHEITTSSNYAYLEKINGNIIIGFEDDQYNVPLEEQHVFEPTIEQLKYVINHWTELVQKNAKEILITRDDNGKITVEGTF